MKAKFQTEGLSKMFMATVSSRSLGIKFNVKIQGKS
jgi:hypothetical protein